MRRPKFVRPTTDLFHEGNTLDAYQLNRAGAFNGPMVFPLRKLRTDRDHIVQHFPVRPPQVILIERATAGIDAARPWFLCYRCTRRCERLYVNSIDILCNVCADLQWTSQRQWRATRLRAKAEKIRWRLDTDPLGKPKRPFGMRQRTFRRLISELAAIQYEIETGTSVHPVPSHHRYRPRDELGRYCG